MQDRARAKNMARASRPLGALQATLCPSSMRWTASATGISLGRNGVIIASLQNPVQNRGLSKLIVTSIYS